MALPITGQIGTWYDPIKKQGYSGAKRNVFDVAADPLTGNPVGQTTPEQTATAPAISPTTTLTPTPAPSPVVTQQVPKVATPQPSFSTPTPTRPSTQAQPSTGYTAMPLDVFGTAMNEMRSKLAQNQDLMNQKAKLLKQVYDRPLSPDEIKYLTPSQQTAVMGNNRQLIDMEVRLINDEIKGRKDTLDTSINYITDLYKSQAQAMEKQRQDAEDTVYKFVQQYGSNAPEALKALYGDDKVQQLKDMGIDIEGFAKAGGIPTISEQRYGTVGEQYTVTIPEGTIASQTNNPLNIKYSDTMAALGASDSGIAGLDGGTFSSFATPEEGLEAGVNLLKQVYGGMTIDEAMRKWSNGAYGAEATSFNPNQIVGSLSDEQLRQLVTEMAQRESGAKVETLETDTQVQADAIERGDLPVPNPSTGRSSVATQKLFAELSRRGVNVSEIYLQWLAAQRAVTNLNSSQMVKFRALAKSVVNTIDEVRTLADRINNIGIVPLNKAKLEAYRNLAGNTAEGRTVSQYLAAVNTLKEEFANLAQGGYAPTEAAWDLAKTQINENYGVDQLNSSLDEIRRLINFRVNALENVSPVTLGGEQNIYSPEGGQEQVNTMSNEDLLNSIPG